MKQMRFCLPLLAALAITGARAESVNFPADPLSGGWDQLTFDNLPPNQWRGAGDALYVTSNASVSVLYKPVMVDLAQTPMLAWRWRVDQAPPATDITRKGGDDRPLAVSVGFQWDPASASFGENMKRGLVEMAAGADAPGRVLDFVYGGFGARGAFFENPYSGSLGHVMILRPGDAPMGVWHEERVDLEAAYRAAFGASPTRPVQIAITSDSDDTGASASGVVANLRFEAR